MAVDPNRLKVFNDAFCHEMYHVSFSRDLAFSRGIEALDVYDYEQAAQGHDVIGWFPDTERRRDEAAARLYDG